MSPVYLGRAHAGTLNLLFIDGASDSQVRLRRMNLESNLGVTFDLGPEILKLADAVRVRAFTLGGGGVLQEAVGPKGDSRGRAALTDYFHPDMSRCVSQASRRSVSGTTCDVSTPTLPLASVHIA
jgi:hypothetical protein